MLLKTGIGVFLVAVAAVWAADATPQASTVGVDARTGKLVRVPATRYTRPVPPKVVASKTVVLPSQSERLVKPRVVEAQETGSEPAQPAKEPQPVHNVATGYSFDKWVEQVAFKYQIDPRFVHAVIKAESNYNPRAISPKGALGLMQLTRSTAGRFGVSNVFNPIENLEGGVRYLRYLLDLYSNQPRQVQTALSLAAYNAGEGAVDRFGGVPPYAETRQYVRRVSTLWKRYGQLLPLPPEPAPKKLEGPRIIQMVDASGNTRYVTESQ